LDQLQYDNDDITLVTAYYRIKSKHEPEDYLKWINNIVMLNKSMVFFSNDEFIQTLKKMRPKEYHKKTVFIKLEMEEFYSYKNFYKDFNKTYYIDPEYSYHTVPLYLIWAEKCMFLKRVIYHNYFNSKCFYWVDIGYFREGQDSMQKFINHWPTTKKCFEDNRFLIGQIRNFSKSYKEKILNFDIEAHHKLQLDFNVCGNIFGGQIENTLKFADYYYKAVRLFIKNKIFIGKDQNIFAYVCFAHPEIVKIFFCNDWFDFQSYLA